MSFLASYRNTVAGARRIATQRAKAIEAECDAIQPKRAARAMPVAESAPEPQPEPIAFIPPVRAIITKIAEEHGLTYQDIVGPRRFRKIVKARFEAIAAVKRARPDMSLPHIGRLFNRDHTTILVALRKRGL